MLYKWEGSYFGVSFFNLILLESFKSCISFGSIKWFEFLKRFLGAHFIFCCGGSFHLPFIDFILSHLDSSSTSIYGELLEEIVANDAILGMLVSILGNI
jgi:hypothetical protein